MGDETGGDQVIRMFESSRVRHFSKTNRRPSPRPSWRTTDAVVAWPCALPLARRPCLMPRSGCSCPTCRFGKSEEGRRTRALGEAMGQSTPISEMAAVFGGQAALAGRLLIGWAETHAQPTVLTTLDGDIIWGNRAAMDLLSTSDHLRLSGLRLSCGDKAQDPEFRAALQAAVHAPSVWICRGQTDHILIRAEYIDSPDGPPALGVNLIPTSPDTATYRWADFGALFGLTPSEVEISKLLTTGERAEGVAQLLDISLETVRTHIRRTYAKLGINSREQLFPMISAFRTY